VVPLLKRTFRFAVRPPAVASCRNRPAR
jgi:hypothetical protein